MADASKSLKLASARKKFKELKKKKNAAKTGEDGTIPQFIKEDTPIESLTSSTHSSINDQVVQDQSYNNNSTESVPFASNSEAAQLPNYFNNEEYCAAEPSSFFDNISQSVDPHNVARDNDQSELGIFNNPKECDNVNVNTFNTYSFQYDTPFKETMPYQEVKESFEHDDKAQSDTGVPDEYSLDSKDTLVTTNTYFTKNFSNSSDNENVTGNSHITEQLLPSKSLPEICSVIQESVDTSKCNMESDGLSVDMHQDFYQDDKSQRFSLVKDSKNLSQEMLPSSYQDMFPNQVSNETNEIQNQSIENNDQTLVIDENICNPCNKLEVDSKYANSVEVPSQSVSNVESLLQLSNQMAQLIEPNNEYGIQNEVSELEKRNVELAALLENERIKTNQLLANLGEYQRRINDLENELKNRIYGENITEMNEISRLKEELQSHIQTIGMLVAEKTEISANSSQFELLLKQKSTECEELQNRLKASRSRVSDLERENSHLKEELGRLKDTDGDRDIVVNKITEECRKLKDHNEELYQDLLESKEKFKTTSENNLNLQKQVQELNNSLSLTTIKIQQLTTAGNHQVDIQVEKLMQEKFSLEKHIAELTQTLKTVAKERDDSSSQYHQYTQQLNSQLANLAKKLQQLQCENELLVLQETSRVKHISDLERQLQNLQNDQSNFSNKKANGDYKKEYLLALDNFQTVQASKAKLEENYTMLSNEKDMLLRDLESKKQTIVHLEDFLEQVRESQPDNTKLLAAMESDKVAASRAIAQNIELKKQMEGMQEVLLKLNNDKVELTEKMTKEAKLNEEIMEDLQKTKHHLGSLADAIEIKDKELSNLRHNSEELNKQVLQQGQLTDRLRHYEAQNHSTHALQEQLQQAENTISKLTKQLNEFKIIEKLPASSILVDEKSPDEVKLVEIESVDVATNNKELKDSFPLLNSKSLQELQEKLTRLELRNKHLEDTLNAAIENDERSSSPVEEEKSENNEEISVLDKEAAMKQLEQKFLHTMDEIARLTDEKQKLEHLVLQLQGETETIGEYVALYQHQRSVLKQRALEKDIQLKQLTEDRAQIKNKLDQLNLLVKQLVLENGVVPPQLMQQHESNNLCEEHSKIHQEINKITEANLSSETNQHSSANTETAEKIIDLLTEIKTSNLVQPTEDIHSCPWCSGQLITV